jgi:hypothetical protein
MPLALLALPITGPLRGHPLRERDWGRGESSTMEPCYAPFKARCAARFT